MSERYQFRLNGNLRAYALDKLLPAWTRFTLDLDSREIGLLVLAGVSPQDKQTLTELECVVLFPLLEKYPGHVTYAEMVEAVTRPPTREKREQLFQALDRINTVPVRELVKAALISCRLKTRELGVNISAVMGLGYRLTPLMASQA